MSGDSKQKIEEENKNKFKVKRDKQRSPRNRAAQNSLKQKRYTLAIRTNPSLRFKSTPLSTKSCAAASEIKTKKSQSHCDSDE